METIIPLDTVKGEFESFLEIENNSRIFFSGQFGLGKTTFLQKFFEADAEKYDVYHLFPLNYQISGNEDIIDLLKYDLLVELYKKNSEVFKTKKIAGVKESSLLFYSWIKERYSTNQLLTSALSIGEYLSSFSADPVTAFFSKLGRPLKSLLEVDKEFQEFKNEYIGGEKGIVEKYEAAVREKSKSEPDFISSLIREKVNELKGTRKSVLVLDDLDRIDPEHIFRILNILSAHFEREHENKFGFDRIVVVADYTNIQHIFHHRFGPKADFSGYIDKFFTISPFYFDNKKAILDRVDDIVKQIRNEEPGLRDAIGESGFIKLFLAHIFSRAVDAELINLRQLLKANLFQLGELKKGSYYENHFDDGFKLIYDKSIKIAIIAFSNTEVFLDRLELLKRLPLDEDRRMPYDRYILHMWKALGQNIEYAQQYDGYWNNYHIQTTPGEFRRLKVVDGKVTECFYDMLIAYIRQKKYLTVAL